MTWGSTNFDQLIFSEPVPRTATVNIQATVQSIEYIPELDSRESQEYRDFVTDFCEEVKQIKS